MKLRCALAGTVADPVCGAALRELNVLTVSHSMRYELITSPPESSGASKETVSMVSAVIPIRTPVGGEGAWYGCADAGDVICAAP